MLGEHLSLLDSTAIYDNLAVGILPLLLLDDLLDGFDLLVPVVLFDAIYDIRPYSSVA